MVRSRPELIPPARRLPEKPLEPSGSGGFSLFWLGSIGRATLSKTPCLRLSPELADPFGPLEVGQDVEELGAGSRLERIQVLP
jgi:hypothetical protein